MKLLKCKIVKYAAGGFVVLMLLMVQTNMLYGADTQDMSENGLFMLNPYSLEVVRIDQGTQTELPISNSAYSGGDIVITSSSKGKTRLRNSMIRIPEQLEVRSPTVPIE